jgi:hypothetical protein
MRTSVLGAGLVATLALSLVAPPCAADEPKWATDPSHPGPNLPPKGRSLLDFVAADGLPFPFEALVHKIEARAGCAPGSCVKAVLIPLGRSLQRTAAAPEFFRYPRAIVAVTAEGKGPMLARDRLFLGYQEKTHIIEAITYNEAAARFEFQVVKDYRPGGTPRIFYASRDVCTACHQNHAPIFSRQVWDETNVNPRIAERLARTHTSFHGIPSHEGLGTATAIDAATERANLLGVIQQLWQKACDARCRADAFTAALEYRLSGERGFERGSLPDALARGMTAQWPGGLAIPNPDLPNRRPLALASDAQGVAQAEVAAAFDPLRPRQPLAVWRPDDPTLVRRFVSGLAANLAESDVRALDAFLAGKGTSRTLRAACELDSRGRQITYDCAGEFRVRGRDHRITSIAIGDADPLQEFEATDVRAGAGTLEFAPGNGGLRARTARGETIQRVRLSFTGKRGEATMTLVDDFARVRLAVSKLDLSGANFGGAVAIRLLADALAMPMRRGCCDAAMLSTVAQEEAFASEPLPPDAEPFRRHCAACHRVSDRFPANFLAGDAKRVSASLVQCAPRIFVRLSMWQMPAAVRAKTPMPPPYASREGHPWVQDAPSPSIAKLRATVAGWLRAETGETPDPAAMLANGYENLRPCLPRTGS